MTMDDPTTSLYRDPEVKAVILAGNIAGAQDVARMYGVAVQLALNSHEFGIRLVTNQAEAIDTIAALPNDTPWAVVADGLWEQPAYDVLLAWFGPPKAMPVALGVENMGTAWLATEMR